jgi:CubicO group peptidase (beta-lactamase class C family)
MRISWLTLIGLTLGCGGDDQKKGGDTGSESTETTPTATTTPTTSSPTTTPTTSSTSSPTTTSTTTTTPTTTTSPTTTTTPTTTPTTTTTPVSYPSLPLLDEAILRSMDSARIMGLQAAIVKDGGVVWAGGYGFANMETEAPVTLDTTFMLASVSKTITGVALMQVWQDGGFDLDEPVDPLVPFSVVHPRHATPITPRNLLTHTSGIKDNWRILDAGYVAGDSPIVLGDFLFDYLDPTGAEYDAGKNFYDWEPGSDFDYSNVGATLGGYMVEALTGTDFAEHCNAEIFAPLGMDETSWRLADLDEANVAHPHEYYGSWDMLPHYGYPDYPDGGLRSSAEQMGRFLAMFIEDGTYEGTEILKGATVAEMKTVVVPSEGQGLIWYEQRLGGDTYMGHNGGDSGVSTEMFYRTSDGTGFVLLMNSNVRTWSGVVDIELALMDAADRKL